MDLKIVKCNGEEWYSKCIGKRFKVHSESRKGGRGKYVVRLEKEDRWLMNGYMYGWVDKEHSILLKPLKNEMQFIEVDCGFAILDIKEADELFCSKR